MVVPVEQVVTLHPLTRGGEGCCWGEGGGMRRNKRRHTLSKIIFRLGTFAPSGMASRTAWIDPCMGQLHHTAISQERITDKREEGKYPKYLLTTPNCRVTN